MSLGGILKQSKTLLVLWDHTYIATRKPRQFSQLQVLRLRRFPLSLLSFALVDRHRS